MQFLRDAVLQFDVRIFSSRSKYFGGRWAMRRWLRHHLVEFAWKNIKVDAFTTEDVRELHEAWASGVLSLISFPTSKPPAHVTIDDRAVTFTGTWPSMGEISDFKPWNKPDFPAYQT